MRRRHKSHALAWIICLEVLAVLVGLALILLVRMGVGSSKEPKQGDEPEAQTEQIIHYEEFTEASSIDSDMVPRPDISEQLLPVNPYSRPGTKIKSLSYIVVHYLGNPGTTAQQNHDYFESLATLGNAYMSANYVVGTGGEIVHCVPDDEVAYASNQANMFSISIENCHPDDSGALTDKGYASLVRLVAYLSDQYGLERDQIIRHYDVTGKDCPKFFVETDGAWEKFRDEVMAYREKSRKAYIKQAEQKGSPAAFASSQELEDFLKENAD